MRGTLSSVDARRLAITAQAFGARETRVDRSMLRALVERLGVVQIDSVNVLVRSHYLPAFSRLGAYDRTALDELGHVAPRTVFEYWGHEASLLPIALHPLFRWRMDLASKHAWGRMRRMARYRKAFVREVLAIVAERGPIGAGEIAEVLAGDQPRRARKSGWWEWSQEKTAIELLFWGGEVTSARRRGFERLYDLPARVIPPEILAVPTPTVADAQRALIERSARALGVATEADLGDYYRFKPAMARPAIASLVEAGVLQPVAVEGWTRPAYLHRDAVASPVDPTRAALLSPFDSLVWARERTERMFGMKFRLEIYVPQGKRVHGYYVLPFLLGDRLVARVDLKSDREAGVLRVQGAHVEQGVTKRSVAIALAGELARMADWLELPRIEIVPSGELATALGRAVRH